MMRESECYCCFIIKYLSQLHKQFISRIPLVQFNWYCERRGDNDDEALTWGRDLIDLFFPKDVYRRSFFFLSRAPRSFLGARFARELADVFEKNEKKR